MINYKVVLMEPQPKFNRLDGIRWFIDIGNSYFLSTVDDVFDQLLLWELVVCLAEYPAI